MHALLTAIVLALAPLSGRGQEVRTALVPHSLTVGDVFQAVIRVSGAGERMVAFPDSLTLPPDLEAAGRRQLRRDTVAGELVWTALYPLTAWRPGRHTLPPVQVRLLDAAAAGAAAPPPAGAPEAGSGTAGGGERVALTTFPEITVRSVLPADTAGIEPQPARDVLGGNRVWWPLLLGAAVLLLALAALLYWYRRRRRAAPLATVPVVLVPPRERALEALAAARASGALEAGDFKRFYSDVSEALRQYLAALDARWGLDLTTSELEHALRAAGSERETAELRLVLESADLVKFARRRPGAAAALADWERARGWVEQYRPPEAPVEEECAA